MASAEKASPNAKLMVVVDTGLSDARSVSNLRVRMVTALASAVIFGLVAGICLWRGGIPSITHRALCYSGFAASGAALICGVAGAVLGVKMCRRLKANTMQTPQPLKKAQENLDAVLPQPPETISAEPPQRKPSVPAQPPETMSAEPPQRKPSVPAQPPETMSAEPPPERMEPSLHAMQTRTTLELRQQTLSPVAEARKQQMLTVMKEKKILLDKKGWEPLPEKDRATLQSEFTSVKHRIWHLEKLDEAAENRCRYSHIRPYVNTRVQLSNNTFIDASLDPAGFIRTSGPKQTTTNAFWQMVWEQKTSVIVMLTNLVDNGEARCDQYWPNYTLLVEGGIQIHLKSEQVYDEKLESAYTVRTFEVRRSGSGEVRTVRQVHVTNWVHHKGMSVQAFSAIIDAARLNQLDMDQQNGKMGPMVVHCSGGAGRTGAFCAGMMMREAHLENLGITDITHLLRYGREQRVMSIQTLKQYNLLHDYGRSLPSRN